MEVRRIPKDSYCVICDSVAEIEVSNDGSLHLFWANGERDREIPLCRHCAQELVEKLLSV